MWLHPPDSINMSKKMMLNYLCLKDPKGKKPIWGLSRTHHRELCCHSQMWEIINQIYLPASSSLNSPFQNTATFSPSDVVQPPHTHTHSVTEENLEPLIYMTGRVMGGGATACQTKGQVLTVSADLTCSLHPDVSADSAVCVCLNRMCLAWILQGQWYCTCGCLCTSKHTRTHTHTRNVKM